MRIGGPICKKTFPLEKTFENEKAGRFNRHWRSQKRERGEKRPLAKGAACPAPADRAKRETAVAASDGRDRSNPSSSSMRTAAFSAWTLVPQRKHTSPPGASSLERRRRAVVPRGGERAGRACLRPPQDSGEEGWAPRCAAGDGGPGGAGPTPAWSRERDFSLKMLRRPAGRRRSRRSTSHVNPRSQSGLTRSTGGGAARHDSRQVACVDVTFFSAPRGHLRRQLPFRGIR
jgi:hypothetical protein